MLDGVLPKKCAITKIVGDIFNLITIKLQVKNNLFYFNYKKIDTKMFKKKSKSVIKLNEI